MEKTQRGNFTAVGKVIEAEPTDQDQQYFSLFGFYQSSR